MIQPTDAGPPPNAAKSQRRLAMRIAVTAALAALMVSTQAAASASGSSPPIAKPTVVLVHGAWADASSFAPVTKRLQRDGYTVLAPPNPLRGLGNDAGYLASFLQQRTTGPVILVGHSYGGAVISNAALADPDVKALVYVDGFAPDQGESILALQARAGGGGDPTAIFDIVAYPGAPAGDVELYFKTTLFPDAFANDLPRRTGRQLAASQRPVTLSALGEPSGVPAWKTLPSWYVLGTQDHAIAPSLQRFMAHRAGSRITTVDAGHLPMLSEPRTVERVIVAAVQATQ